ncbi:helix-turn-helix domain-containing protein [Paraclostridium bifermentans]|uniref:helix-turn-helix domain-containing protein n=1 Tax=Paraclostridium bifermentans TaxID=1490 RepID=UPI00387B7FAA
MLRLKRKRLMITQTDACRILGISNSYLSRIENKKRSKFNDCLFSEMCLLYQISSEELKMFLNQVN